MIPLRPVRGRSRPPPDKTDITDKTSRSIAGEVLSVLSRLLAACPDATTAPTLCIRCFQRLVQHIAPGLHRLALTHRRPVRRSRQEGSTSTTSQVLRGRIHRVSRISCEGAGFNFPPFAEHARGRRFGQNRRNRRNSPSATLRLSYGARLILLA